MGTSIICSPMSHPCLLKNHSLTFPDLTLPALSSSTLTSSFAGELAWLVTVAPPVIFFTPLIGLSVTDAGAAVMEVIEIGENAAMDPHSELTLASTAPYIKKILICLVNKTSLGLPSQYYKTDISVINSKKWKYVLLMYHVLKQFCNKFCFDLQIYILLIKFWHCHFWFYKFAFMDVVILFSSIT